MKLELLVILLLLAGTRTVAQQQPDQPCTLEILVASSVLSKAGTITHLPRGLCSISLSPLNQPNVSSNWVVQGSQNADPNSSSILDVGFAHRTYSFKGELVL